MFLIKVKFVRFKLAFTDTEVFFINWQLKTKLFYTEPKKSHFVDGHFETYMTFLKKNIAGTAIGTDCLISFSYQIPYKTTKFAPILWLENTSST